eukprot:TRINITY_DN72141_c0_g1_i1.p1 TRINITY_DN72141_c0_g1~~TRINITY_DN72141_c0_g1_i1.p1  ORF type:complete len:257 (-),score=48.63 TRINITY_DN72141_c0_g1_i1:103-873(-)
MGGSASQCKGSCFRGVRRLCSRESAKDIIVIVGPSGVGKSTLIKRLMTEYSGRFGFSVSHTTRGPRPGEIDGKDYNFTTVDKMQAAIEAGKFIEHANVHGNFYGSSFEAVEAVVNSGRICLLDIDVQGAEQMKKSSLDAASAYMFIAPPSVADLETRLRGRGTETEEKIQLRLSNARKEISFAEQQPSFFGMVLVNADLEKAYDGFRCFMKQSCGTSRLDAQEDMSPGYHLRSSQTPRPLAPYDKQKTYGPGSSNK